MAAMSSFAGHNGGDGDGVLNAGSWAGSCDFSADSGLSDGVLRSITISVMGFLLLTTSAMSFFVGYDVGDVHCCSVRNLRFDVARMIVTSQSFLPLDHVGLSITSGSPMWE
ncbi:hypothetical protein G5I_00586 [Acromyrmex echinatior]|uniref:Uncharacterized protein n=1 Tax=Acromyrmex echinatior TaxID=103372 RepID=F4W591_ACREC|nr:hypothetical protein G5I_00586 [Acromyrmex echinatior]